MIEAVVVIMILAFVLGTLGICFAMSLDGTSFFAFPLCIIFWFGIFYYTIGQEGKQKQIETHRPQVTVTQQILEKDDVEELSEKLENLKHEKKIDSLQKEITKLGGN